METLSLMMFLLFRIKIPAQAAYCFLCSYAVVYFRYLIGRGNVTAHLLFDSHCSNSCRITNWGLGFSVLINF